MPFEGQHGETHRHLAALLIGIIVTDRRSVLNPPHARDSVSRQQHRLGERRLTAAEVPKDADVVEPFRSVRTHKSPP